jgi:hypothetical protein
MLSIIEGRLENIQSFDDRMADNLMSFYTFGISSSVSSHEVNSGE